MARSNGEVAMAAKFAIFSASVEKCAALVDACERDFCSQATEVGDMREPDDEPVAVGKDDKGQMTKSPITFGAIREARAAIETLRGLFG